MLDTMPAGQLDEFIAAEIVDPPNDSRRPLAQIEATLGNWLYAIWCVLAQVEFREELVVNVADLLPRFLRAGEAQQGPAERSPEEIAAHWAAKYGGGV